MGKLGIQLVLCSPTSVSARVVVVDLDGDGRGGLDAQRVGGWHSRVSLDWFPVFRCHQLNGGSGGHSIGSGCHQLNRVVTHNNNVVKRLWYPTLASEVLLGARKNGLRPGAQPPSCSGTS
jgi:hypothetical protein